jgi:hypothetical protein
LYAALRESNLPRKNIIENWLIESKKVLKFVSSFTRLDQILENLEDRLSLLNQGVDSVFEKALSELWKLSDIYLEDE